MHKFGVFRILLLVSAVVMVAFGLISARFDEHIDWNQIPEVFVPVFAPLIFILILFDMMMCKILKSDVEDIDEKLRLRDINRIYIIAAIALMLSWTPFIVSFFQK